jgi:antitoxin component YwqK of YwqJK toxin-antitoxin module
MSRKRDESSTDDDKSNKRQRCDEINFSPTEYYSKILETHKITYLIQTLPDPKAKKDYKESKSIYTPKIDRRYMIELNFSLQNEGKLAGILYYRNGTNISISTMTAFGGIEFRYIAGVLNSNGLLIEGSLNVLSAKTGNHGLILKENSDKKYKQVVHIINEDTIIQYNFINNTLDCIIYYRDILDPGTISITVEPYINGQIEGCVTKLTHEGLTRATYRNGSKDGFIIEKNGFMSYESYYLCGKFCGYRQSYISSVLQSRYYYIDNVPHGLQIIYTDDGGQTHTYYFNGNLCTVETWKTYLKVLPQILELSLTMHPSILFLKDLLTIIENYLSLPADMLVLINTAN